MRDIEHQIQKSFFEYISWKHLYLRNDLAIFAIPNGGMRNIGTAIKLKAEGCTAGVFDCFLAKPNKTKHGLWIEFKAGKNKLTENQKIFMECRLKDGYECKVCYNLDEAIKALEQYLSN